MKVEYYGYQNINSKVDCQIFCFIVKLKIMDYLGWHLRISVVWKLKPKWNNHRPMDLCTGIKEPILFQISQLKQGQV